MEDDIERERDMRERDEREIWERDIRERWEIGCGNWCMDIYIDGYM